MARTKVIALLTLCSCCAVGYAERLDAAARQAIDTYRTAIKLAQTTPSRGHLEAAFNAIEPLFDELVLPTNPNAMNALEAMSEQELTEVRRELVGLIVFREEGTYVGPDLEFFKKLAARGDRADRAFFAALSSTHPEIAFPVYMERLTDDSACTSFGHGTLVSTYVSWADFRRQYPKRYQKTASHELEDVVQTLTESTCACDDRASVEKELTEFLQRANVPQLRARVEARLMSVRENRANFRFACRAH